VGQRELPPKSALAQVMGISAEVQRIIDMSDENFLEVAFSDTVRFEFPEAHKPDLFGVPLLEGEWVKTMLNYNNITTVEQAQRQAEQWGRHQDTDRERWERDFKIDFIGKTYNIRE
jgi:hypothetical protein